MNEIAIMFRRSLTYHYVMLSRQTLLFTILQEINMLLICYDMLLLKNVFRPTARDLYHFEHTVH